MWSKRNYIALLHASFSLWIISTQVYTENLNYSETQDIGACDPPPSVLEYANLREDFLDEPSFLVGAKVDYECKPGYTYIKLTQTSIQCLENFTWSDPEVFCTRIPSCEYPPKQQYAEPKEEFLLKTIFAVGDKVTFQCRPGYIFIRPFRKNFLICQPSLEWSTIDILCEPRSCGNPGEINNGDLEIVDFLFGSRVTYKCDTGYTMITKINFRECLANGQWSNTVPECEPMRCIPPDTITNGNYYPEKEEYQYRDAVTYSCSRTFDLIGKSSIYCTEHGNWSSEVPECKVIRCPEPSVRNAQQIAGFPYAYSLNSIAIFQCYEGFQMKGSATIRCNGSSLWEPEPPKCLRKSCGDPGDIENGNRTVTNNFLFESSIIYECKKGFKMISVSKLYCQADGKWNRDPPTCEEVCDSPPVIQNAILVSNYSHKNFFNVSETVQYECKLGYTRIDKTSNTITCSVNLTWSSHETFCQRVSCGKPEEILHGDVKAKDFLFESKAYYTCDHGYKMASNTDKTKCQANGKWSKTIPECREVCDSPPVIQNAVLESDYIHQNFFNVSETVQYECKPGYTRIDKTSNTITCSVNLTWSSHETFCQRVSCGKPKEILHGDVKAKDFLFESKAYYTCDPGYRMASKTDKTECQANGKWSKPVPECRGL